MRINYIVYRSCAATLLLLASGLFYSAGAQTATSMPLSEESPQEGKPIMVMPEGKGPLPVTGRTNLYCAGSIQHAPDRNDAQIIGGEEEQEQRTYSQGQNVYINIGAQNGVRVGQEYMVVRPRGQFKSSLSKKKGWLGVYTQEVGNLRVVEVKDRVSVAVVNTACDDILLGDLLRATPQRVAPLERDPVRMDRFADPTGKQKGRIVMARDTRELLSRDQVVFIDLGAEDNVKSGDYLTIYRPLGTGNITRFRDEEVTPTASAGFESDMFKGGKFSSKAQRVKEANTTGIYGPMATTPGVKDARPPMPRKIVGEMVILSVQFRTATAVITRVAQEVHTGDFVEVQ